MLDRFLPAGPDRIGDDLRNAIHGLELELPYEGTGEAAVTGIRRLFASQVLLSLVGCEPAPF